MVISLLKSPTLILNTPDSTTFLLNVFINDNSVTGKTNLTVFVIPALILIFLKSLNLLLSGVKDAYKSEV
jgi:hypothetical protein